MGNSSTLSKDSCQNSLCSFIVLFPRVELLGHDFLLSERISLNSPRSTPRAEHDRVLHAGIPLMWQEFGQEMWAGICPEACMRHKFLRASSLCQMRAKIRFKTTMQSCQEGL